MLTDAAQSKNQQINSNLEQSKSNRYIRGGAHRARVCMRVFIGMSGSVCAYTCTMFKKHSTPVDFLVMLHKQKQT